MTIKASSRYDFLINSLTNLAQKAFMDEKKYKKRMDSLKIINIILSFSVTVLLGLKLGWFSNMALVLSAALTAFNTWEGYANYKELWIRKTELRIKLTQLMGDLMMHLTKPENHEDMEKYKEFYRRYEELTEYHSKDVIAIYQRENESHINS
ncbi:DUF4231 domain-containing protein [Paenibacillus alginolyticus]|uniref:SLATT domain-containing protein n=1 Tax=Paenibacillus alginolyticus TaxID=59839 RepID=UPI0004925608|nr:DUF4231 domain-containing protein [Paenibacillus alginolyticus]MCY9664212.1 DUF4231 domain-containing protein [Paenibacillus alginolyticus]